MADRYGIAWIEVLVDNSKVRKGLKETQSIVTKSVTGIEQSSKKANTGMKNLNNTMVKGNKITKDTSKSFLQLTAGILKSAPAFAVATAAIAGVYTAIRLLRDELFAGLKAVEEFETGIISTAAFITTFSKKAAEGDIAGSFQDALGYSRELNKQLEIMDAKTIATGKDLRIMSETMISQGVLLDINNEAQKEGFINLANALKLLTKGQNQEIQIRQEIRALMKGQSKETNVLFKLLQQKDANLKENLKTWKKTGSTLVELNKLLLGFGPASLAFELRWAAIGTTFQTIHDRILRGAFEPMLIRLLDLAIMFKNKLIDATTGALTPLARKIQTDLAKSLETVTKVIEVLIKTFFTIITHLDTVASAFMTIGRIAAAGLGISFVQALTAQLNALSISAQLAAGSITKLGVATSLIFAAFAGFQIGTFLSEEFEAVRIIGIMMVDGLIKAWHTFGLAAKFIWLGVKESFGIMVDSIKTIWAKFLLKVSDGLAAIGQKERAKGFESIALGFLTAEKSAGKMVKAVAKLREEDSKWAKEHKENIDGLLKAAIGVDLPKAPSGLPGRGEVLAPELVTPPEGEEEIRKAVKKIEQEMTKKRNALRSVDSILKTFLVGDEKERQEVLDHFQGLREKLEKAFEEGSISGEKFKEVWIKIREEEGKALDKLTDFGNVAQTIAGTFKSSFADALLSIKDGFDGLRDFAIGVLNDIAKAVIQKSIVNPIATAIGGFDFGSLFGSAKGNAFSNGQLQAFASGGILDSPTFFNTKSGPAVAGEAGTEAILPLKRTSSGDLGVQATTDNQQQNNAPQIILNYSPVVSAIDTQSGLQFLTSHQRVITGMAQQAFNKAGLKGFRR